jgi:RimJ/RimL family protein N-acetyltransferase
VAVTGERFTRRLRLTPVTKDSAAALLGLHQDPGIAAWYGGPWTQEQARAFAVRTHEQWTRDGVGKWLAHSRTSGELVGRGGLSLVELMGRPRLEVGWAVRQHLWGQGYASELAREALRSAFAERGADEVVAFTEVHNVASRRVMERLGMEFVQEIRRPGLVAGTDGIHDDAPFALYRLTNPT